MVASVASSGARDASKVARLLLKVGASPGAAFSSAPAIAAATVGTRGMSYQRCGLGSLPVMWSTVAAVTPRGLPPPARRDRKSTRPTSSHDDISYAVLTGVQTCALPISRWSPYH